jgi:hypothetical protein
MAANVNRYPENAVTIFDILSTYINSKNSDIVSACLKALGTCSAPIRAELSPSP